MTYSKAYAGALIAIISSIIPFTGLDVRSEDVTGTVTSVLTIIGIIISVYGRYKAGGVTWYGAKEVDSAK
jgi:hypothetical protein